MTTEANNLLPTWAVVELMGHKIVAGHVSEQTVAGGAMLRIDQPAVPGREQRTELVNASSIYSLTPCTEETALAVLRRHAPRAAWEFGLPRQSAPPGLPAPETLVGDDDEDLNDDLE